LIGVLIITVVPNGMIMLNAPPWSRDIVTGLIILLAVLIDVEQQRARKATPKIEANPSLLPAGYYLNDVLTRLARTVEEKLVSPYCRIYLIDRETGDLVPQTVIIPDVKDDGLEDRSLLGRNSIVSESKASSSPIRVANVTRSNGVRVIPMHPRVQSALAVPLEVQKRMIGIIEVQSTVPDAFNDEAVELLQTVSDQMAGILEDAWLLESGWLVRRERDALRHLWDDLYLSRSELADWVLSPQETGPRSSPAARGEALRNLLIATVEGLRPPSDDVRDPARYGRGYRILQLTYVEEHVVDAITRELHISRRQYFYDLKEALEALADALVRNHRTLSPVSGHS
ncbi:MAG TPA: GAF domain-containing protein, partial [Anaerolineae bacterium]